MCYADTKICKISQCAIAQIIIYSVYILTVHITFDNDVQYT